MQNNFLGKGADIFSIFLQSEGHTENCERNTRPPLRSEPAHYPKDEHELRNFKLTVAATISTTERNMNLNFFFFSNATTYSYELRGFPPGCGCSVADF